MTITSIWVKRVNSEERCNFLICAADFQQGAQHFDLALNFAFLDRNASTKVFG